MRVDRVVPIEDILRVHDQRAAVGNALACLRTTANAGSDGSMFASSPRRNRLD
jgi:hypothetical protein